MNVVPPMLLFLFSIIFFILAGRWTQEEHNLFLQGLNTHQKQWKLIADMVKTRTVVQIRTHAQKYFQKLNKTNGSNAWNKYERTADINTTFPVCFLYIIVVILLYLRITVIFLLFMLSQQEHENQRTYTYPKADSRANSFCSSGDSIDSHGTSAEGVDSEGEAQRALALGNPCTVNRSGSFNYPDQIQGGLSGSTSCCSSTLSSPTGSGNNVFNGMNIITRPGVLSTTATTTAVNNSNNGNMKTNQRSDMVRKRSRDGLKSMLGSTAAGVGGGGSESRSVARSPRKNGTENNLFITALKNKVDPDVYPHRVYGSTITMRNQIFINNNTTSTGSDRFTPAVHMPGPLTGLPDDLGAGMGLGLDINQDLYFPGGSFPEDPYLTGGHLDSSNDTDLSNAAGFFMNPTCSDGCGSSSFDAPPPTFDDLDLMNMLDTIDWNEPVVSSATADSTGSNTCNNSRPWSPMTDTASSVSSFNPAAVAVTAAAASVQRYVGGTSMPSTSTTTTTTAPGHSKAPSPVPVPTTMPVAEQSTTTSTSNSTEDMDAPVHKRHRVAFSNVIEELELVSQAVRRNSTANLHSSSTTTTTDPAAHEHISLFNLFQRDEPQAIGRLPPLRALVQQARERGCLVAKTTEEENLLSASTTTTTTIPSTTTNKCNTDTTTTTTSSGGLHGLEFDDHDFDFAQFMGDDFQMEDNDPVISLSLPTDNSSRNSSCDGSSNSSTSTQSCHHSMAPAPAPHSPTSSNSCMTTISSGASNNLFGNGPNILDANGGINANSGNLLTVNMMPSSKTPGSNSNTPQTIQRKRGRPRKHSISHPSAPASTPSASTAKSLLPALTQSVSYTQLSYIDSHLHYQQQQQYAVPVNAAVAQAYNYAVSTALNSSNNHNNNTNTTSATNSPRPFTTQRSYSADFASNNPTTSYAPEFSYSPGNYYGYGSDIRCGMSRTMSSESDTMMAAVFDPKIYDSAEFDNTMGMLEDFE